MGQGHEREPIAGHDALRPFPAPDSHPFSPYATPIADRTPPRIHAETRFRTRSVAMHTVRLPNRCDLPPSIRPALCDHPGIGSGRTHRRAADAMRPEGSRARGGPLENPLIRCRVSPFAGHRPSATHRLVARRFAAVAHRTGDGRLARTGHGDPRIQEYVRTRPPLASAPAAEPSTGGTPGDRR